jgi:hypothetical protein
MRLPNASACLVNRWLNCSGCEVGYGGAMRVALVGGDKQEGIQEVARNLLATGMDPAQIAAATGLTLEQVQQLQQN